MLALRVPNSCRFRYQIVEFADGKAALQLGGHSQKAALRIKLRHIIRCMRAGDAFSTCLNPRSSEHLGTNPYQFASVLKSFLSKSIVTEDNGARFSVN